MSRLQFILVGVFCLMGMLPIASQTPFRVMCYNVENLFDCENDSLTNDDDFTPQGAYYWTPRKLKHKLSNIAKVIVAVGEFSPPSIIGLCEIENESVLKSLVSYSPLRNLNYRYVQYDSPDKRGVDVALLYRPNQFHVISSTPIAVNFQSSPNTTTRDILYVKGVAMHTDTLHVFVCHFASRLGGELESEERRIDAASILRSHVDSLNVAHPSPNIIIMGDFNDYPTNMSMHYVLQAQEPNVLIDSNALYNLFYQFHHIPNMGTHKHGAEWGVLDQLIVSGNLLQADATFYTTSQFARIYNADFLLIDDERHFGKKPFRTFLGMKYLGGFADHLPIVVDFFQR
jgi:predicted extracellular nuclease